MSDERLSPSEEADMVVCANDVGRLIRWQLTGEVDQLVDYIFALSVDHLREHLLVAVACAAQVVEDRAA